MTAKVQKDTQQKVCNKIIYISEIQFHKFPSNFIIYYQSIIKYQSYCLLTIALLIENHNYQCPYFLAVAHCSLLNRMLFIL